MEFICQLNRKLKTVTTSKKWLWQNRQTLISPSLTVWSLSLSPLLSYFLLFIYAYVYDIKCEQVPLQWLAMFVYSYAGVFSSKCCQHKDLQLLLLTCCICCAAGVYRLFYSSCSEFQTPCSPCAAVICPSCWCHQLSREADVISLVL